MAKSRLKSFSNCKLYFFYDMNVMKPRWNIVILVVGLFALLYYLLAVEIYANPAEKKEVSTLTVWNQTDGLKAQEEERFPEPMDEFLQRLKAAPTFKSKLALQEESISKQAIRTASEKIIQDGGESGDIYFVDSKERTDTTRLEHSDIKSDKILQNRAENQKVDMVVPQIRADDNSGVVQGSAKQQQQDGLHYKRVKPRLNLADVEVNPKERTASRTKFQRGSNRVDNGVVEKRRGSGSSYEVLKNVQKFWENANYRNKAKNIIGSPKGKPKDDDGRPIFGNKADHVENTENAAVPDGGAEEEKVIETPRKRPVFFNKAAAGHREGAELVEIPQGNEQNMMLRNNVVSGGQGSEEKMAVASQQTLAPVAVKNKNNDVRREKNLDEIPTN